MAKKARYAYQLKVTLRDIHPPIWRRILVPDAYSFWDLHVAIQDSMGWQDCHLHAFRLPDPETGEITQIGIPDDDPFLDEPPCLPGWDVPLVDFLQKPGAQADYEYDFGDGWEHEVVLEDVIERKPREKLPRCTDGARACPPEDCGGVGGYERILEIIADLSHEEHGETKEWLGKPYDPEAFDPKAVEFDDPKVRWKRAFM